MRAKSSALYILTKVERIAAQFSIHVIHSDRHVLDVLKPSVRLLSAGELNLSGVFEVAFGS